MTEQQQLEDIVRYTMRNQNVEYRPNCRFMRACERELINKYGGIYMVCKGLNIPSRAEWIKELRMSNEELPEFIKDVIYDAMDKQEVSHQPKISMIPGSHRRLLELYGGLKAVCKKMGILTKKKKAEAVREGLRKIEERDSRLDLEHTRKLHANDIY